MLGRDGSTTLIPESDDRMRVSTDPAVSMKFNDAQRSFDVLIAGRPPGHFELRPSVSITKQLLTSYAGEYVSDALGGAVYVVTASDSTITLRTGTSSGVTARLMFTDTFLGGGGYTIVFARTGGQVSGFDVTNGRMRHVKFVRRRP